MSQLAPSMTLFYNPSPGNLYSSPVDPEDTVVDLQKVATDDYIINEVLDRVTGYRGGEFMS
jgi:hypothetical protein